MKYTASSGDIRGKNIPRKWNSGEKVPGWERARLWSEQLGQTIVAVENESAGGG